MHSDTMVTTLKNKYKFPTMRVIADLEDRTVGFKSHFTTLHVHMHNLVHMK